ncbi:hypothetical protein ACIBP6_18050 [Nonomuraea terrae]|uniref:hypothetical protein n=1 Tax=Nonomuraea terrae TaxID=2530383 RepID=UPI0037909E5F
MGIYGGVMGIWDVRKDGDRAQWTCTPLVSVGPLRLGMSAGEVVVALDHAGPVSGIGYPDTPSVQWFQELGVTAYYEGAGRLAGVAVDALNGPQVMLDGTALVGRVPSALEAWIHDYTQAYGLDLHYVHEGNPGSADVGLLVRAQRAGDVVLSRPLFLIREWAMAEWDHVPASEWKKF